MEPPFGGGDNSARRRYRRKYPSSSRFLGISSSSQPTNPGVELTEHDIFDASSEPTPSTSASSSSNPNHPNHHNHHQPANHQKNFGILAALPESETRSIFNHKASASSATSATASVSSSSSSSPSSRMIPPMPTPRRPPAKDHKMKYFPQSAPVNVPVLSAAMAAERLRRGEFDDISEDDEDEVDVHMLPPHEIVAANTPVLACSVLEGVGRTLKGRDLRQVRNAVWRKTGYLDPLS